MLRAKRSTHRQPRYLGVRRARYIIPEESAALIRELDCIIQDDRYPLSPRIVTLTAILAKLRPEPIREPLPQPKHYEPPRAGPQTVNMIGICPSERTYRFGGRHLASGKARRFGKMVPCLSMLLSGECPDGRRRVG